MARSVHGGRGMLNLPGHQSTAAIVAEVEDTTPWHAGKARNGDDLNGYNATPSIKCEITDCDSKVRLEFDVDSPDALANSLHKIDTMIANLTAMREGLEIEADRFRQRLTHIPNAHRYGVGGWD